MDTAGRPRVFISYAHYSPEHVEAVRQFWTLLRDDGFDARLDLPASTVRQDWPVWMMRQFQLADYILVIASAAYRSRAEGLVASDVGRGVQFEGALLRELVYSDREKWFPRVWPVVLPGESSQGIPIFLNPHSASSLKVKSLTAGGMAKVKLALGGGSPEAETAPAGDPPARRSTIAELDRLASALGEIRDLADAVGRNQAISWLPPGIREYIEYAPATRQHLLAILQGCARFTEAGRVALLDLLRHAFPAEDPSVRRAIRLIEESWLFDEAAGR